MSEFRLPRASVKDPEQQDNNLALIDAVNALARFVAWGNGAPTHTPVGPQLYLNFTGGAGSTAYFFNNVGWTAVA